MHQAKIFILITVSFIRDCESINSSPSGPNNVKLTKNSSSGGLLYYVLTVSGPPSVRSPHPRPKGIPPIQLLLGAGNQKEKIPGRALSYRRSLNAVNVVPTLFVTTTSTAALIWNPMDNEVTTLIWNVQQIQLARVSACGFSLDATLTPTSVLQGYPALQLAY